MKHACFTLSFILVIISQIRSNDLCQSSTIILIDTCLDFTFDLANYTASSNPTLRLDCENSTSQHKDFWFKVQVPMSGNLSVETFQIDPNVSTNAFEAYRGNCSTLTPLACGLGDFVGFGRIELENLVPSETIYLRYIIPSMYIFGGSLQICTYDTPPQEDCNILLVELGSSLTCDPLTNTFEQEVIVHFRDSAIPEILNVRNASISTPDQYMVTSNPFIHTISVPATDVEINYFSSYTLESNSDSDCKLESYYFSDLRVDALPDCYHTNPVNNTCATALALPVTNDCSAAQTYEYVGADPSGNGNHMCSTDHYNIDSRDIWFTVQVPPSGKLLLDADWQASLSFIPVIETYRGLCGNLNFIAPVDDGFVCHPSKIYQNLIPGETLYLRISDRVNERQGTFQFCAIDPGITDVDFKCINAHQIDIGNTCQMERFSFHLSTEQLQILPDECVDVERDIWFYFEPDFNSPFEIEHFRPDLFPNSQYANYIEVYLGHCQNLQFSYCIVPSNNISLVFNEPVYLRFAYQRNRSDRLTLDMCAVYNNVNCNNNLNLTNQISNIASYNVNNKITINSQVSSTAKLRLTAGRSIEFLPSFEISKNGELHAYIERCN